MINVVAFLARLRNLVMTLASLDGSSADVLSSRIMTGTSTPANRASSSFWI